MHKRKRASPDEDPDPGVPPASSSSSSHPPPPKRHHPDPSASGPSSCPPPLDGSPPPPPASGSSCGTATSAPTPLPSSGSAQTPAFPRTRSMVPPMVFPGPASSLPTYPPPSFYPFQQQQQQPGQAASAPLMPPNPPTGSAMPSMAEMHQAAMEAAAAAAAASGANHHMSSGSWMGAPPVGYPVPVPLPFAYPFPAMPFRFMYPFPSMFPMFHDHAAAASMSFPPMFGGFPPGMFASNPSMMNPHFSGFQRMTFRADFPFQIDESIPNGNSFYLNVLQRLENDDVAGASQEQIEDLPTRKFTAEEKTQKDSEATGRLHQQKCAICLDDFEEGTDVKSLPCFHIFHPVCIDKWLPLNKSCPVCRVDIDTEINFEEEGSQTEANQTQT